MANWRRRLTRLGVLGGSALGAVALSGCTGGLPTTVTSVTGTLEPYLPTLGDQGIPAEQVDFTVGNYSYGSSPIICVIDVYDSGQLVGTSIATFGAQAGTSVPGGVDESVAIDTNLASPFDGNPSDATVSCVTGTGWF